MRQAYDYWQDQPGISLNSKARSTVNVKRIKHNLAFKQADNNFLTADNRSCPVNTRLSYVRNSKRLQETSSCHTENEVHQETISFSVKQIEPSELGSGSRLLLTLSHSTPLHCAHKCEAREKKKQPSQAAQSTPLDYTSTAHCTALHHSCLFSSLT